MANIVLSIAKSRKLSSFEARLLFIQQQLKQSFSRKQKPPRQRVLRSSSKDDLAVMPKRKDRRKFAYADWTVDESPDEEFHNPVRIGEPQDDEGNDRFESGDEDDDASPVQNGESSKQYAGNSNLDTCIQAANDTVRQMKAAQHAIKSLQTEFKSHADEFSMVEGMKDQLADLKGRCKGQETRIAKQETTISTLTEMNQKVRADLEGERLKLERDRRALQDEKAKMDKRFSVELAEAKLKRDRDFEKATADFDASYHERRKELENEFALKREENNKRLAILESQNENFSKEAAERKKTINDQEAELQKVKRDADILHRAMKSFENESQDRIKEVDALKKEFALETLPITHFQKKFGKICDDIERISTTYFQVLEGEDTDTTQKKLAASDPYFESIPIGDSDNSRDLCSVHAQRIISGALCEHIWKPLRSDITLLQPQLDSLLQVVLKQIHTNRGERVANVWAALTSQALESMPSESVLVPVPAKEQYGTIRCVRAQEVISKVLVALSPLVTPLQKETLEAALSALIESSIQVWNEAQSGEMKLTIIQSLDPANYEEWHPEQFDPTTMSHSHGTALDLSFGATPQIFTLFPRIIASETTVAAVQDQNPPGSWPSESYAVCIHPGRGLSENSPLVTQARKDQEARAEYFKDLMEKAKREFRRGSGHSRKTSREISIVAPQSPSEQWVKGGAMRLLEQETPLRG